MMFLIIVSDGYITAQMNLAGIGSDQFIDDLQDCGLAGSVIADDRYMFALFQFKIKMFEQGKGPGLRSYPAFSHGFRRGGWIFPD